MARLDFDPRGLESVVRASVHYFNTEAELDRLGAVLPNAR
jgi:selenocysteine lyase/cysteine desulfurase